MGHHHVAVREDGLQIWRVDAKIRNNSYGVSSRLEDVEVPYIKEHRTTSRCTLLQVCERMCDYARDVAFPLQFSRFT